MTHNIGRVSPERSENIRGEFLAQDYLIRYGDHTAGDAAHLQTLRPAILPPLICRDGQYPGPQLSDNLFNRRGLPHRSVKALPLIFHKWRHGHCIYLLSGRDPF
jgi:hypothetical protein